MNNNLFPQNLLVEQSAGQVFTTSLKVAEHFQKQHRNVRRSIEKLLTDLNKSEFAALNFERSTYIDSTGRTFPMYRLTHDGSAILAMGFSGHKALQWKIIFLNAFREMERQLAEQRNLEAEALNKMRPHYRQVALYSRAKLSRRAIAKDTGKSVSAVAYTQRRLRELGLLH
ncbi:MAG: hypothetical protein CTY18_03030 [Methylomonas sp.]|nr:MAG: hypothetical protein CTY18_03030 [Methylomonas sp.]